MNWFRAMASVLVALLIVFITSVLPTAFISEEYVWYSSLQPADLLNELDFYLFLTFGLLSFTLYLAYSIYKKPDLSVLISLGVTLAVQNAGLFFFFKMHVLSSGIIASGATVLSLVSSWIFQKDKNTLAFACFLTYLVFICSVLFTSYVIFMLN